MTRASLQRIRPLDSDETSGPASWWHKIWPWLMSLALIAAVQVVAVFAQVLPAWANPWIPATSIVLIGLSGFWLAFRWCWARDYTNGGRCITKRKRLLGRCPNSRTHGLNAFDFSGVVLLIETSVTVSSIFAQAFG